MGLFDSVLVDCPHCGATMEYQSKADNDPYLRTFTVETVPDHIAFDVLNNPEYCPKCRNWSALTDDRYPPGWRSKMPRPNLVASKVRPPEQFTSHPQGFRWWEGPFSKDDIIKN